MREHAFNLDYAFYILAILVLGLFCISAVRISLRSKNPDLARHYQARKKYSKQVSALKSGAAGQEQQPAIQSVRQRRANKNQYVTPWGWAGSPSNRKFNQKDLSGSMRGFADRLIKEKELRNNSLSEKGGASIRALLEDRYGPVSRGMTEIPYRKVKRPLLRDPSEPHDQVDDLGQRQAQVQNIRKKLQFLSAMNIPPKEGDTSGKSKKVEFRYVDLKDLKSPWGW